MASGDEVLRCAQDDRSRRKSATERRAPSEDHRRVRAEAYSAACALGLTGAIAFMVPP